MFYEVLLVFFFLSSLVVTQALDCSNVPLSFSVSNLPLRYSKNLIDGGTVSASLTTDGSLSVTFSPKEGCTLVDALHVDLVSESSGQGTSAIPVPGQFGCQAPAEGGTQTLNCKLSDYNLPSCCEAQLRLFLHAVMTCDGGGAQETAFGGSSKCTTKRWCTYEVVDVDESCDTCTQCSGAECVPLDNGITDTGCDSQFCNAQGVPSYEACDGSGGCTQFAKDACTVCSDCNPETGSCENVPNGDTDEGCEGTQCASATMIQDRSCQNGECVASPARTCGECQSCSADKCEPVDGEPWEECSGTACGSLTSQGSLICRGGVCTRESDEPCGTCETCTENVDVPGGSCNVVADNEQTDACSGTICESDSSQADRRCIEGQCKSVNSKNCGICKTCPAAIGEEGSCSNVENGSTTGDCADQCSGAKTLVQKVCQDGECLPTETQCDDCKTCDASSATCTGNVDNGETDGNCAGSVCLDMYTEATRACQNGSCGETPSGCSECSACSSGAGESGSCQPVAQGETTPGCESECTGDKTAVMKSCNLGNCEETTETCGDCKSCDPETATCGGTTPNDEPDGNCSGTICTGPSEEATLVCRNGKCEENPAECGTCQSCDANPRESGSCSNVETGETTPSCNGRSCVGGAVVTMTCDAGTCMSDTENCPTCTTCSGGICTNVESGSAEGCENTCDGNTAVQKTCQDGTCVPTSEDCGVCRRCEEGQCVTLSGPQDGCNSAVCEDGLRGSQSCVDGKCEFEVGEGACSLCQECTNGSCTPLQDGQIEGCSGPACADGNTLGQQQCKSGMCDIVSTTACGACNTCDASGNCVYDSSTSTQEVCNICGEQCTAQPDGTGSCQQVKNCASNQICMTGATDDQDTCVPVDTCTTNADCETSESCVGGKCVSDAECTSEKKKFCDDLFKALGGTSNESKCCPDTSACVKNALNLSANSVCSTECGARCDPNTSTGDGVKEVFCRFGDSTSPQVSNVPLCSQVPLP